MVKEYSKILDSKGSDERSYTKGLVIFGLKIRRMGSL